MLHRHIRFYAAIGAALACSIALAAENAARPAIEVKALHAPPYYVLGQAIVIEYSVSFPAPPSGGQQIEFNDRSLPDTMRVQLSNERGDVPERPSGGGPPPLSLETRPRLWPGEEAHLSFAAVDYYNITQPGLYQVRFTYAQQKVLEHGILILPPPTDQAVRVAGVCTHPARRAVYDAMFRVACKVSAGKTVGADGKTYWLVVVGDVEARGVDAADIQMAAPERVRVAAAELDHKMRVWTLLEAQGKRSVVIWNLRDGTYQTLIPWCEGDIDFQSARVTSYLHAKIVMVGRPGEVKMTSLSIK